MMQGQLAEAANKVLSRHQTSGRLELLNVGVMGYLHA
jgi:hypothetical protein